MHCADKNYLMKGRLHLKITCQRDHKHAVSPGLVNRQFEINSKDPNASLVISLISLEPRDDLHSIQTIVTNNLEDI
jgi:hypothetical protein